MGHNLSMVGSFRWFTGEVAALNAGDPGIVTYLSHITG